MRWLIVLLLSAGLARAEGDRAGDFDYYVLSLSWSPTWCALEGEARGADQCDRALGFVLHGLWPQFEDGWPSYCPTAHAPASRSQTRAMADIMGSAGSAWHQWKKHGVCSGLSPGDYFDLARKAYGAVTRPEVLRKLSDPVRLPANVVEEAFVVANEGMEAEMITITCKGGRIEEARVCLTKDLDLRACSASVARDCRDTRALLEPVGR